ncbi:MAG: hypothetical protein ABIN96_18180 [Rubrivivax sp.]
MTPSIRCPNLALHPLWSLSSGLPALSLLACVLALPVAAQTLTADAIYLRKCRAMTVAEARLACYDALPIGAAIGATASTTARAAMSPAPPAPKAAVSAGADTFGLARIAGEPDEVESRIEGRFTGWGPGTQMRLTNGQVWRIDDASEAFYDMASPRVVVKRAALGGFRLEIDGIGKAPRVKRVQ